MIVLFAGSAITGLFFMEGGGRPEGGHENYRKQFSNVSDRSGHHEIQGAAYMNSNEGFRVEGSNGSEDIHQISGIAWLVLMFLHTIQHWNWYKKLFSLKHIMQNKMITSTFLLFLLLVLTSIGLWIKIIPRGLFNLKEVHSVIGQVLVGFVLIHIIQQFKLYIAITQKLFTPKTVAA